MLSRPGLPPVSTAEGERLRSLASMARALGFSRDLFDVLERAVSEGCRVIDADSGSVSVLDRPAGLVRVLVNVGDLSPTEEPRPRDETYDLASFAMLSQVVAELRPWTCSRTAERPDPQELALLVQLGKEASMGAPVVVDGELWGEIYFARHLGRPAFDDIDLAYIETLAAILAAGVSRAVRESALTELAYQDPLTGLANRRRLDEAAAGMVPAQTGLVVVSLDVNDLKPVNDRDGHAAGDRLLRAVAKALTEVVEELPGSLAARTGGDEFCLVAPTSDVGRVERAVSRFMAAVRALPHPAGVSCGIAWTGSATASPGALFAEADRAMYHAKQNGRTEPYCASAQDR